MDVPELARRAVSLYISYPVTFITIALVGVPANLAFSPFGEEPWWWLAELVLPLIGGVVLGALAFAAATASAGGTPTFTNSYRVVWRRLSSILGATVMFLGAVVLLTVTIVGIPFALWLFVRWFFCEQAVVLRGLSARGALRLSAAAVKGSWWQVLGALLVILPFIFVLTWAPLLLPLSFQARVTLSVALGAICSPFVGCYHTLIFLDLCERKNISIAVAAL